MQLTVTDIEYTAGETVGVGVGLDDFNRMIRFGIEWRYALDIRAALAQGEEVVVEIESWQILGVLDGSGA